MNHKKLNSLEKKLLSFLQDNFPISPTPYKEIANSFSLSEKQILEIVNNLKNNEIIRRIGATYNSEKLGYKSTLIALKAFLPDFTQNSTNIHSQCSNKKLCGLIEKINNFKEVTHNYLRDNDFNIWLTLTAKNQKRIEYIINNLKKEPEVEEIMNLPAVKKFKIKVQFNLGKNITLNKENKSEIKFVNVDKQNQLLNEKKLSINKTDKLLLKFLQNIPVSPTPFKAILSEINLDECELIKKIIEWKENGIIRRLGAILNHYKIGFDSNLMAVWEVKSADINKVANFMSLFPQVTHCYQRKTYPKWRYNLYTVIHGKSKEECFNVIKQIVESTQIKKYKLLFSINELKKSYDFI